MLSTGFFVSHFFGTVPVGNDSVYHADRMGLLVWGEIGAA